MDKAKIKPRLLLPKSREKVNKNVRNKKIKNVGMAPKTVGSTK